VSADAPDQPEHCQTGSATEWNCFEIQRVRRDAIIFVAVGIWPGVVRNCGHLIAAEEPGCPATKRANRGKIAAFQSLKNCPVQTNRTAVPN
jgi:hypothetical protein